MFMSTIMYMCIRIATSPWVQTLVLAVYVILRTSTSLEELPSQKANHLHFEFSFSRVGKLILLSFSLSLS